MPERRLDMSYVPGFEYDVFISYAHVDNRPPPPRQDGWIKLLHDYLESRLPQLLGRAANFQIFRDPKLDGNDEFAEVISNAFAKSAAFISVVSPSYVKSKWCLKELGGFCEQQHEKFSLFVGHRARVFSVIVLPVDDKSYPPSYPQKLRDKTLGYEFFEIDSHSKQVSQFWPDRGGHPDVRFEDEAERICSGLAKLLEEMATKNRPVVYLAEVTDDLIHDRQNVQDALDQRGIDVLPENALPVEANALRDRVTQDLSDAKLSVHMIGEYYGKAPSGDTKSIVQIQLELALELSQSAQRPVLIWITPDLQTDKIEESDQRSFVEELEMRPDPTGLSDFQRSVRKEELIEIVVKEAFRVISHVPQVSTENCACITFQEPDQPVDAMPLQTDLRESGIGVVVTDTSEVNTTEAFRSAFETIIKAVDAVIIFYGHVQPLMVQALIVQIRRQSSRLREAPLRVLALYDAPHSDSEAPERKPPHGVTMPDVEVIDCRGGHRPEAIRPLVEKIKTKPQGKPHEG